MQDRRLTDAEIAAVCECDRSTAFRWHRTGLPRKPTIGQLVRFLVSQSVSPSTAARLATAKAVAAEQAVRRRAASLIESSAVASVLKRLSDYAAEQHVAAADRLAPLLAETNDAAEIRRLTFAQMRQVRDALATYIERQADEQAPE